MSSRLLLLVLMGTLAAGPALAGDLTDPLRASFDRRQRINRVGMSVLGGWAVANIAIGSALYFADVGDTAFHQMNAMWNTVNLGLAAAGLFQSIRGSVPDSLSAEIRAQHSIEKILLLNAGLDVGYIAAGFLLTQLQSGPMVDSYPGWGRGLMLQGAFLLVFDLAMYAVHSRSRPYEAALP